MKPKLLLLASLALAPLTVHPETLLQEAFAYPDGRLADVSGGLWTVQSGTLPLNVFGGLARLEQADATGGREDVNRFLARSFDPVADNVTRLYAGFTVNLSALPYEGGSSTAGSYFAHFKASAANQFYARVGANREGAAPGAYRLAVANADWTSATSLEYPADLQPGITYDVVLRLDLGTDTSTLWINPVDEFSPNVTATDPIKYSGTLNAFALRQGTTGSSPNLGGPGAVAVGNLRVATAFPEVQAVPEPAAATLLLLGGAGLLMRRRRPLGRTDGQRFAGSRHRG